LTYFLYQNEYRNHTTWNYRKKGTNEEWKIRGDKPVVGITHICMEISQGNSLCNYLYLKLAKMSCFPFYFFVFLIFKIREQEQETGPAQQGGLAPVRRQRCCGKSLGEWVWCKKCAHMYVNAKMKPAKTIPWMGEEEIKGSTRRGEFKKDIFDTL
jgi:hypothetical protein